MEKIRLFLEKRWEIIGWWQIGIIFIVFAITGTSSMFVGRFLMNIFGITPETNGWIRIPVRIVSVFFVYQILLVWIGFLFGQFAFFWKFEKKMWSRILRKEL
jgi:manganese efflux pump family protein